MNVSIIWGGGEGGRVEGWGVFDRGETENAVTPFVVTLYSIGVRVGLFFFFSRCRVSRLRPDHSSSQAVRFK